MNIGIYQNIPAAEYHKWTGASNSRLCDLAQSPAHARWRMDHPTAQTPAMALGEALHLSVLEPTEFASRYAVAQQCMATKKGGERCTNGGKYFTSDGWQCGVHGKADDAVGVEVIAADDWTRIIGMRDAIAAHPAARALLDSRIHTEASVIWDCPETGVRCKMRADALCRHGVVADVKTTTDASPQGFAKAITNFGYAFQAAHYLNGLAAVGESYEHFVFIVVEKEAPHAVGVYRLTDDVLGLARVELMKRLRRWGECETSGVWPAYSDQIEDISLTSWATKELENAAMA